MIADTSITDDDLASLERLTNLQFLDLSNTAITDVGMSHLKNLSELRAIESISATKVTSEGLSALEGLQKLVLLQADDTEVTDLAHLRRLTALTYVVLDGNPINDDAARNRTVAAEHRAARP